MTCCGDRDNQRENKKDRCKLVTLDDFRCLLARDNTENFQKFPMDFHILTLFF